MNNEIERQGYVFCAEQSETDKQKCVLCGVQSENERERERCVLCAVQSETDRDRDVCCVQSERD